ncbi:MAG: PEP-CTERM sorting domain-containing protein, partial [Sedimentisphaerales bacterium]|nr:PEP-CTERM sorting domain-containing protein [Sedimentisphaerales bacterium]
DWAKMEVMLRDNTTAGSPHYSLATRKGGGDPWALKGSIGDSCFTQARNDQDGGSWGADHWGVAPNKLGVQRVSQDGYEIVQTLVDHGSGWEVLNTQFRDMPDTILAGLALTAHDNAWLVQAYASNVAIETNPGIIGVKNLDVTPLAESCGSVSGMLVTVAQMPEYWVYWDEDGEGGVDIRDWQWQQAEYLVKNAGMTDYWPGDPTEYPAAQYGQAVRAMVNLYDSGGRNAFYADNGYPDETFPGIDAFLTNPGDPADGDGEDNFAVMVEGCIELTAGLHILGGIFDDGVLVRINGQEIGRTNSWNQTGVWLFTVPETGLYSLEAIGFEGGGGAGLELYEFLPGGTMVLMNDVARGASPVYVPEPATIALLGFGGLSMLRIRRKR